MARGFTGKFEKIDDYRWRIPQSYMKGMRVPGVVYSDEEMLRSIIRDNAPEQVANAAHLPGIVRVSMAMPDIHWGYGLPIGGVIATDAEDGGVITPGGVGYDINCLSGDTKILLDNGAHLKIKDFKDIYGEKDLLCFEFETNALTRTPIERFLEIKPRHRVMEVCTLNGNTIKATGDHPFWTPGGMVPLKDLNRGDVVAVYPFEGVPYEDPGSDVILEESDVRKLLMSLEKDSRGNGLNQIITQLKKRGLLPLRYDSPQLPYLLKVMGYNFGDGNIFFNKKRGKGCVSFYGKPEDLADIRADIGEIGFSCSRVYSRKRDHRITTNYGVCEFSSENSSCKVGSSGFAALLVALGTPLGNKTNTPYRVPSWIMGAPLWQKRLFLAAFFGAEMSAPSTMTDHGYNFYCPTLSMNKNGSLAGNARGFLSDIADMLADFGVSVKKISKVEEYSGGSDNRSVRLRMTLSGVTEELISLYSRIGFEYNRERKDLSNAAAQYLKFKRNIISERRKVELRAKEMAASGSGARSIFNKMGATAVNLRFIERSIYGERKQLPRLGPDSITFDEFYEYTTRGVKGSGMIWDRIESVREIEHDGYVYDFTVAHKDHNFIAGNFVVSNCGVRLLRTDLEEKDAKGRMKEIVDALFAKVPTGVGSTGKIKVDFKGEKEILTRGAGWAVDKGYGWPEDIEHCEENGAIEGADPSKVSDRAYERGRKQPGTLGSGNHFLEVQVVDEIYREDLAKVFGIHKGQVTVMIHTGSRGVGHQICGDYAQKMVGLLGKYGISVPDRQLSCVPVKSPEGKDYLGAMRSAANYAWANRQVITHLARESFRSVFGKDPRELGMFLVYDVAHNIAKIEKYDIKGQEKLLCVHRKGATRAFPPGHDEIPADYKEAGQPVIIPGDMGRCSFLLAGTKGAEETFYSTCHGAGRLMSRTAAKKSTRGRAIQRELADKGIMVRYTGRHTLHEEVSDAYKDVREVVDIVQGAGISEKVARMRPLGVIKG